MSSRLLKPELEKYDSADFANLVKGLHKNCKYEISRAKSTISKLDSGGTSFNIHDKNDFKSDIKALETSRAKFIEVMKALHDGKKVTAKDIEAAYDSYCFSLEMLGALTDKWETVIASGVIKTAISMISLVGVYHDRIKASGPKLEKELKELKTLLDKAQKSRSGSYIKAGLSLALDVAVLVSPQARALSAISKFAIGGLIDVGSNLLVGKPEDFVGTTLGMTVSGTELEYKARGLTKGADALAKAGKAMKISGMVGSAKEISDAHKAVGEINAKIGKVRSALVANAKLLEKAASQVEVAKRDIRNLVIRLQANAKKADSSRAIYQKMKAARDRL